MPHTATGRAFTGLVLEVFRVNGRLLAAGNRLSKPVGLASARWQVLGAIEGEDLSVSQIARRMGLARQNVQRIADVLVREYLVTYAESPDHRRAKMVCLTKRGHTALQKLWKHQEKWANEVAACAPQPEMKTALAVLREIRAALETSAAQAAR